eukprot:2336152-Amphidinium_carterae.1
MVHNYPHNCQPLGTPSTRDALKRLTKFGDYIQLPVVQIIVTTRNCCAVHAAVALRALLLGTLELCEKFMILFLVLECLLEELFSKVG